MKKTLFIATVMMASSGIMMASSSANSGKVPGVQVVKQITIASCPVPFPPPQKNPKFR